MPTLGSMEVKCPLRLLQEEELGLTATRKPCEMALWRGAPLGGEQERQALDMGDCCPPRALPCKSPGSADAGEGVSWAGTGEGAAGHAAPVPTSASGTSAQPPSSARG